MINYYVGCDYDMAVKPNDIVNNIRALALDMISKNGGDVGQTMSITPTLYALYNNVLNIIPSKPNWINRDKVVVANKDFSAAFYSMLYYAGYDYSIEDLKRYRDVDSYAPGSPIYNTFMGIDGSSTLYGDAIGQAVGMAIAQRYYSSLVKNINPKLNLIDYYVYVVCSIEDIMEGASYESLSFASMQKLNKLIVILENNNVTKDGDISKTFTEDIETRFDALDFNIINVKNGNNISSITDAIKDAKKSDMPSLIIVNTLLGDTLENAGTNKMHFDSISKEELISFKQKNGISLEPFNYDIKLKNIVTNNIVMRMEKIFNKWNALYNEALASKDANIISLVSLMEKDDFNIEFDSTNYEINEKYSEQGIISNQKVINFITPKTKYILGCSADSFKSSRAIISKDSLMTNEDPLGRNIELGYRENAMSSIMLGLANSNLRCFGSTSLVNASKMNSIRVSALSDMPVNYIFYEDSFYSNTDGGVYLPCEQLAYLRSIPNLITFRPCDINEIIGVWEFILKNKKTTALVISNENTHILKHTNGKYVKYGAYIVRKEKFHLDGVIIATGYEVTIALKIAEELFNEGIDLRIVSMPSVELFLIQNPIYEEKLLPKDTTIFTLEAGSTLLWNRFASNPKCALGVDTFAVSGKKEDTLKFLSFDYNSLIMKIKNMLEK